MSTDTHRHQFNSRRVSTSSHEEITRHPINLSSSSSSKNVTSNTRKETGYNNFSNEYQGPKMKSNIPLQCNVVAKKENTRHDATTGLNELNHACSDNIYIAKPQDKDFDTQEFTMRPSSFEGGELTRAHGRELPIFESDKVNTSLYTNNGYSDANLDGVETDNQNFTEKDNYHYDDEDIRRDAADHHVALIVHIALMFFFGLFVVAIIISGFLVSQYGFVSLVAIISLLTIVFGCTYFVMKLLTSDAKLRPVQRKLRRWRAIAAAVVVQEIRNFQLDMNEHLLLMDGDVGGDNDSLDETNVGSDVKKKRKSRSIVFGFIKPLLKRKNGKRRFKGFSKKKEAHTEGIKDEDKKYIPPVI
mmetsp:Transcript_17634/g.24873  ORF Transcript_17634/g.24873 Transcript_17634/m.24873 type:complete len:358 (+) Transcript_17634:45-1118(+)